MPQQPYRTTTPESLLAEEPLLQGKRIDRRTQELLGGGLAFSTTWWVWLLDWYMDREDELKGLINEWQPDTIRYEIQLEMRVKVSDRDMNRILCGRELLTTNNFYRRPWFFMQICNGLWDGNLSPNRYMHIDDPAVPSWGIVESILLNEPDTEDEAFSPEVLGYIAKIFRDAGLVQLPRTVASILPDFYKSDVSGMSTQDPGLFEMEYGAKMSDSEDVDTEVAERLRVLFQQITTLPLQNGSVKAVMQMAQQFQLS